MSFKIIPKHDQVLLEPTTFEAKSEGGLLLPDTGSPMQRYAGRVVAIGPKVKDVSVGENVVYFPNAAITLVIGGKPQVMVTEGSIFCAIEKTSDLTVVQGGSN